MFLLKKIVFEQIILFFSLFLSIILESFITG